MTVEVACDFMDSDYQPQGMTFSLYTRTSSTKKLYAYIYIYSLTSGIDRS